MRFSELTPCTEIALWWEFIDNNEERLIGRYDDVKFNGPIAGVTKDPGWSFEEKKLLKEEYRKWLKNEKGVEND